MQTANQPIRVEQCNCFAARKAARQITRLYEEHLQPTGLRVTQFLILASLNELKSAPVNGLAERLDVERTAMGKMTTLLERDGLVKIQPSPTDARSRVVELTGEGARMLAQASVLWQEAQHHLEKLNGKEKIDALRSGLAELATG